MIFEAGMLQALTNAPNAEPTGWIPLREESSPKIPFDFATERFVIVKRLQGGEPNLDQLRGELERRVRSLLEMA